MKRILVGINFSEQSAGLAKFAFKLAQYFGAEVHFAYIAHETQILRKPIKNMAEVHESKKADAKNKLSKFAKINYGKQYHAVTLMLHVDINNAPEGLSTIAKQIEADLLIIGKHTNNHVDFFDDTAGNVISRVTCPVMTIPDKPEFHFIKRIIYASEFLLEDCAAIFEIQNWLDIFKGELICLYVSKNDDHHRIALRKMAILEKLFTDPRIKFRCIIANEEKAIERYASLSQTDMLCTMHKNRTMFQWLFQSSKSKELTEKARRPMIVFNQNFF